jgi:hypothetical protein
MSVLLDKLLPLLAVLFSLGGIVAFIVLFVRDMNVFWLIVAPVILAVYQIPAAVIWWLWKKRTRARKSGSEPPPDDP